MTCLRHDACESYNYNERDAICEINSASDETDAVNLIADTQFEYFRRHSFQIDKVGVSVVATSF